MKLAAPAIGVLALLCLSATLPAAELLTYRGSFAPVKGDEDASADKSFVVQVLVAGDQAVWTLSESGRGAWPWTERFGKLPQAPTLLYDRGDGHSTVALPAMKISQPIAADAQWQQDGLNHRVEGETKVGERAAWQVSGSNNYGPKRRMAVAKEDGAVLKLTERVFVGQGTECNLQWELNERTTVDNKAAEASLQAWQALDALRAKLSLQPQRREIKWSDAQLKTLRDELPAITAGTKEGLLVAVLQAAEKDVATQDSRGDALAALTKKAIGAKLEKFELTGTSGEVLKAADLPGNVTVLHLWDYRDAPLEEPYGQVGYLDFLARKQKGVKVYGVMIDDRLAEAASQGQAKASARKVKAFMNLSYPILLDDAALLKQIGDPRTTGAKLPLWVVIGKDGKIAHYHVGFYDVKRDQGLADLEAAINAVSEGR